MRASRVRLLAAAFGLCCLLALAEPAAENEFRFAVLADLHVGLNDAVHSTRYDEMVREIIDSQPKPKAVFAIGDITDHGQENEFDHFIACFLEPLKTAGIPLYAVPGSRDSGGPSLALWTNKLGALYQAVTLCKTRFILTSGVPDTDQLAWIRQTLDAPETGAASLVVMLNHFPLWPDDFGGIAIPNDTLRGWMADPGVDLFLCGNRHFQASPILHEHPSGKQTWHVLNESAVMGHTSKITEGKGKSRTVGGCGFQIYDVSGTRIEHSRKTLEASGFARTGPLNVFALSLRPPAPAPPPAAPETPPPPAADAPAQQPVTPS